MFVPEGLKMIAANPAIPPEVIYGLVALLPGLAHRWQDQMSDPDDFFRSVDPVLRADLINRWSMQWTTATEY